MWRISADFWDRWEDLYAQFALCDLWSAHIGAGHFPDADMLPLGHIGIRAERGVDRASLLTHDEQQTLMSLWSICRSPLMMGGDLPTSDAFTIGLLTNPEVLAVNQTSSGNRQFWRDGDQVIWVADAAEAGQRFVACFNLSDQPTTLEVPLAEMQFSAGCRVRDLWQRGDLGHFADRCRLTLPPHGSVLLRLSTE
jgi:hypothetical protein